jgi:hypothetical protein
MHSDCAHTNKSDEQDDSDEALLGWEGRVFAVAVIWCLPGILLGCLVGMLLTPDFLIGYLLSGAALGALAGGLLEAGHLD